MRSQNTVMLVGRASSEPEIVIAEPPVTRLTMVTTHGLGNGVLSRSGTHRLIFHGRLAGTVGRYVRKGDSLAVQGRLEYDRGTASIVVRECSFLNAPEEVTPQ